MMPIKNRMPAKRCRSPMPAELVRAEQAKREGRPFVLGTPRGDGGMDAADGIDVDAGVDDGGLFLRDFPTVRAAARLPHPRRSICLNAVSRKKPHPLINRMRLFQQDQSSSSRSYWRMEPVIALTS